MEVIFERNSVNSFTMKVDLFDTVPRIKEKIQKHHGIPISDQTLIFENTVLSDDFNILFSNIIHQSRIQLLVASDAAARPPAKKIKIAADLPPPSDVTAPIMNMKKADIDCEVNGDHQKAFHEGNGAGAENRVKVARAAGLRVVVVYEGKKIPVEVSKDERVAELRKKLEKMKVKLPKEGCFFIHKQDLMEDDQTFRWHNVNQGDEIDMFAGRVTGGY